MKRRAEAARLLRAGHVAVDGKPAKPAAEARVGQRLRVEEVRRVREYEVLAIPAGNVARKDAGEYARLVSEQARETT